MHTKMICSMVDNSSLFKILIQWNTDEFFKFTCKFAFCLNSQPFSFSTQKWLSSLFRIFIPKMIKHQYPSYIHLIVYFNESGYF